MSKAPIFLLFLVLAAGTIGSLPASGQESIPFASPFISPELPENPVDGGCGGNGGGGPHPPPPPTTNQFRLSTDLAEVDRGLGFVKIRAYSRFEQLIGSQWQKVDAGTLSVSCFVNGTQRDQDSENNAGFTDVTFWAGPFVTPTIVNVACVHSASHLGTFYNETTQESILLN